MLEFELAGSQSYSDQAILDATFWNDAVAIYCDEQALVLCVCANRASSIPLFWCSDQQSCVVSNTISELLPFNHNPQIDMIGLAEALLWDAPLRDRTLVHGFRQIPSGYALQCTAAGFQTARYRSLALSGNLRGDATELAQHAGMLHAHAIECAVANTGRILVPISGGLDSRCILAHVTSSRKADVSSVTFGHSASYELVFGRRVANVLQVPWHRYLLNAAHYLTDFTPVYSNSAGLSHLMHCHIVGAVQSTAERADQVIVGFMGDPVAGADCDVYTKVSSPEMAVTHLLARSGQTLDSIGHMFSPSIAEFIQDDIRGIYDDCVQNNEPLQFDEYYFVVERQSKINYPHL